MKVQGAIAHETPGAWQRQRLQRLEVRHDVHPELLATEPFQGCQDGLLVGRRVLHLVHLRLQEVHHEVLELIHHQGAHRLLKVANQPGKRR